MNYELRIIPNAKKSQIIERSDTFLKIKLKAPTVEGKANEALIKFLAEEFKTAKSNIEIVRGLKSRNKVVKILST